MNANFHLEDLAGGGSMRKRGGQFPIQNVQIEKSSFFRFIIFHVHKEKHRKICQTNFCIELKLLMDVQRFPAFQFLVYYQ
jgi:hypothetical protein